MSGRTIQGRQTKRFASFWFVAIGIALVWSLLAQFRAYSRLAKAEKDQERVRVCESHNRFQRSGNLIGDYDLVRLFRSFPTSDFAKGLQEKVDMLKPEYVIAAELPTQRETDKRYLIYFPGSPQELTIQIKLQSGPSILKVENTETQNVAVELVSGKCHLLEIKGDFEKDNPHGAHDAGGHRRFQILLNQDPVFNRELRGYSKLTSYGGNNYRPFIEELGVLARPPNPYTEKIRAGRWLRVASWSWGVRREDGNAGVLEFCVEMDLKSHQLDFNVPANASTWASLEELFEKMNLMTEDREMANGTYRVSREEF